MPPFSIPFAGPTWTAPAAVLFSGALQVTVKGTSSGGASKVTFTNGTTITEKMPVYLKLKKIAATDLSPAGMEPPAFLVTSRDAPVGSGRSKLNGLRM